MGGVTMTAVLYIDSSAPTDAQVAAIKGVGIAAFSTANALYFSGILAKNASTKRIIADCQNHKAIEQAAKLAGLEFALLDDLKPIEPAKPVETPAPVKPAEKPKGADAIKVAEGG